jgi:hypothetical protein
VRVASEISETSHQKLKEEFKILVVKLDDREFNMLSVTRGIVNSIKQKKKIEKTVNSSLFVFFSFPSTESYLQLVNI